MKQQYPLSARILRVAALACWAICYATVCFRNFGNSTLLFGSLLAGGVCMLAAELIAATEEP